MAEYIDRKSLGIGYANPNVFENEAYADGWNAAIKIINEAPAADVAEVVRCGDCKHYRRYSDESRINDGECSELIGLEFCVDENFFCGYGVRKDAQNDI